MKKIILSLIAVMSIFSSSFAQKSGYTKQKSYTKPVKQTAEQKATRNADSLKAVMNLTPEQYNQVVKINLDYIQKKDAVKAKYKAQMKQDTTHINGQVKPKQSPMGQEIKTLNKERIAQIKGIVSEDQYNLWQAWKKSKSKDVKGKGQNYQKGNRPEYQKKSEELKSKIQQDKEEENEEDGL